MLEWLIIGGGIHGTAISLYLTHRFKIDHHTIRVLDPHKQPLALWQQFTANTGMKYLRSPKVHHLHYDPWSITTFAQTRQGKPLAEYIPLYQRPSLALFNAYSQQLIERYQLSDLRLQGRAMSLQRSDAGWQIETDQGVLHSRRVVLAIGSSEQPHYPAWSKPLVESDMPLNHIFDRAFRRDDIPRWDHCVIIGGGISAAQLAITLSEQQPGTVTLLSRHEPRIAHFDSDPCWVTNLCLDKFLKASDYVVRREMIQQVRNRGSMPPDVFDALESAVETDRLSLQIGEVRQAKLSGTEVELRIKTANMDVKSLTDRLILATGFDGKRPGGQWLDAVINRYGLPTADCGYPIVDETLCWGDGLYVMGALAELEVGPVARNIIGARLCAERIGRVVR